MQFRTLGKNGPRVSALGLGCMGMSQSYGPADEAESLATLDLAVERGINFFDTAEMYGFGANEELVGRALSKRRDNLIIATKFGIRRAPGELVMTTDGSAANVKRSCDGSLARLGMDYIDLYYLHRVDPKTPIEETVDALAGLVKAGKVRYLGLSEASSETVRKAQAVHPIHALQSEYSLWTRDPENGVLATCQELGISLVPYSPLGRGFLTGQIKQPDDFGPDDFRRHNPRFQGENFQKNLDLVAHVQEMAAEKGVTAGQVALAWLLAQDADLVPIPGTKRCKYLEENLGALDVQLTPADLARIEAIAPQGAFAGSRYPEAMLKMVNI